VSIARIPAPAGSPAFYWFRVTVTNKGPDPWGGAVDVDLPSGFTPFFSGAGWVGGGCAPSGQGDATCPVNLPAGQSAAHDLGLRSAQSGPVSIGAAVRSFAPAGNWTDPNPADNSAQLSELYDVNQDPNRPLSRPAVCTVAFLQADPQFSQQFLPFLNSAIERIGHRGIRGLRSRPRLDDILTCPKGRVVVRVSTRRSGRTVVIAKVDKTFKYCCVGRSTHRVPLTNAGRRLLASSRRLRILVTVRLFDGEGGSVQRSRNLQIS
jgi:hypothetical protein